ncbi:MAG: hypothetical protein ACPGQQ_00765 [Candidatus Puniceispirillaceae bacterium]
MIVQPRKPELITDGLLAQKTLEQLEAAPLRDNGIMRGVGRGAGNLRGFGGGASYLDSVLASTICDLDATVSDSYGGSGQTWANLIASPADGASQSDYDFYLGAGSGSSTDDPTFNGTAGDAAAYWSFDGGDYFSLALGSSNETTFLLDMLQANTDFWIAIAGYFTASACGLFCIGHQVGGTQYYLMFRQNGAGKARLDQRAGSTNRWLASTGTFSYSTPVLLICSHDVSANTTRFWLESTSSESNSHTLINHSNTPNSSPPVIMAESAPSDYAGSGSRLYHLSFGNEFIDDTDAANIYTHLESRHARDYTP